MTGLSPLHSLVQASCFHRIHLCPYVQSSLRSAKPPTPPPETLERELLLFPTVLCPIHASGLMESDYLTICSAWMTKLSQQSDSGQFKQLEGSVNPDCCVFRDISPESNLRSEVIESDCEPVTTSRETGTTNIACAYISCLALGI